MKRAQHENESRFLDRLMSYRDEYRNRRAAEVNDERARRHTCDEVYMAGCWIHRTVAEQVARGLQKHGLLMFLEIVVLLVLSVAVAAGIWWLFGFLFLP
jgi:hypothetical protein